MMGIECKTCAFYEFTKEGKSANEKKIFVSVHGGGNAAVLSVHHACRGGGQRAARAVCCPVGDVSDDLAAPYDYVMVPGYGADSDYEGIDVTSSDVVLYTDADQYGDTKPLLNLGDDVARIGIYVEGFVVLTAKDGGADLSVPFLAYYGDWSAPGMLDYATMLNEDTVPYSHLATELGAYFTSSFAYRLGANLSVTMDGTENTTLKAEHITVSPNGDTYMDGVELVNVSQMRNASALHFTATTANGASVSCVVGVSDQLTYTGLRLDFDEMTTTMYFDSTIDLPGVYLEPYGFALSGKHNTYGTDGLTWSVSDPTIANLDEYSKTTLVANKDVKTGDSGVLLYMGLMLLALTGSAWVLRKKRAR